MICLFIVHEFFTAPSKYQHISPIYLFCKKQDELFLFHNRESGTPSLYICNKKGGSQGAALSFCLHEASAGTSGTESVSAASESFLSASEYRQFTRNSPDTEEMTG